MFTIIGHICTNTKEIMNNLSILINSWKTVFTKNDIRKMLNFSTSFALDKFIQRNKKIE